MSHAERKATPSRREFLDASLSGGIGAASLVSACSAGVSTVRGVCHHDCPDACAWLVTTRNGKLVKLEGDRNHPITRGTLCGKMDQYLTDVVSNPDRLLYPLRRVGPKGEGRFERVSWDQALDDVAARFRRIIQEDGATAILPYSYGGTEGVVQSGSIASRFFARLGATRLVRSVCGDAGSAGVTATMGTTTGILPEDIVHSRFVLIWGANPALTGPHSWAFIEEARRRGARIVTVDPQRTASASKSDYHVQPIPGTDAALALGMMRVIVDEGLHDAAYVDQYTLGFDKLRASLAEYPLERVAAITGLKPEEIRRLARDYAGARPSTIRLLIGMEHRAHGAMAFRTIACLPALTGAWRELGGGLSYVTDSLFALDYAAVMRPDLENQKIRSVNMVQLGRALTDPNLKPPIRAMVVWDSNPATIAPNQNLVLKGLRRDDLFTVVLEQFMTDTARHADYVFPAAAQVEVLDLLISWGQNYLALNRPATPPAGEAVANTEFFRRLARRLDVKDSYLYDSDEQIARAALKRDHVYLKGITYERLAADGWAPLNLPKPWLPFAKGNFPTPSGKCEFYAQGLIAKGLDPLPRHEAPKGSADYPLMLLTSKASGNFLNSSHVGVARAVKAEGEPRLRMHPADAGPRKIRDGEMVRVHNAYGSMLVRAQISDACRAGIVTMTHGWWASLMPGKASANALTSDGLSDLGEGGDFHDTRVEVAKA